MEGMISEPAVCLDKYKLKLLPKKLRSGKCQVKFYATALRRKKLYGYILVDATLTVREVVEIIKAKLEQFSEPLMYYNRHLYMLGRRKPEDVNFMVFEN